MTQGRLDILPGVCFLILNHFWKQSNRFKLPLAPIRCKFSPAQIKSWEQLVWKWTTRVWKVAIEAGNLVWGRKAWGSLKKLDSIWEVWLSYSRSGEKLLRKVSVDLGNSLIWENLTWLGVSFRRRLELGIRGDQVLSQDTAAVQPQQSHLWVAQLPQLTWVKVCGLEVCH